MGAGGYASDLFSLSGIVKILELICVFITLLIHRHGDNGDYVFFATTQNKLQNSDENIDAENLGNSALVTFMVITLVLVIGKIFQFYKYLNRVLWRTVSERVNPNLCFNLHYKG